MSLINQQRATPYDRKALTMNIKNETCVWFLRHGKTIFNYDNCTYDEFTEMLSKGHRTPLDEDDGIDFALFPKSVELICHSPARRAMETAKRLQKNLNVGSMKQIDALHEVKLDKDIIRKQEFKSLKDSRPHILVRWFDNQNKLESFAESIERVKEIESFLHSRQEKSIILITHGWFLRLLELYFVQDKREGITLSDLLDVKPVKLGKFVKTTFKPESSIQSKIHAASA